MKGVKSERKGRDSVQELTRWTEGSRQGRAHHYRQATKQSCAGEEAEAADVIRPGQQGMVEGHTESPQRRTARL